MTIMMDAVGYMTIHGLLYSIGLGAAIGTLFAPISGTIYGAFFGSMVGFPLGIVGGIIIDAVTFLFFNPISNPQTYRRTLTILGGLVGFGGTCFGFLLLFSLFSVVSKGFIPHVSIVVSSGGIFFYMILGLIGGSCAVYVSHNYASRYLAEIQHKREDNLQASATTHG